MCGTRLRAQGLAVGVAGAAASVATPSRVIGAAGVLGSAAVFLLLTVTRPPSAATSAGVPASGPLFYAEGISIHSR